MFYTAPQGRRTDTCLLTSLFPHCEVLRFLGPAKLCRPCSDLVIQKPSTAASRAVEQGSIVQHIQNCFIVLFRVNSSNSLVNPGRLDYQLKASVVIATLKMNAKYKLSFNEEQQPPFV